MAHPDFLIIGAMKCGTSTLQAQLAAQTNIFMTTPKEPNFFSDDDVYSRGVEWYESLFAPAALNDLKGEASTHYTKLPIYPKALPRLAAAVPSPKLIYMIRDPIARLISHYIHEWSQGVIDESLDTALDTHPELIAYSRYGMQIAPYVERFGADRIFLTSLERIQENPQCELSRIGAFLGIERPLIWHHETSRMNVSAERIRKFPFYALLVEHSVAGSLRRALVPQAVRNLIKRRLQKRDRPQIPHERLAELRSIFEADRELLRQLMPQAEDVLNLGSVNSA